MMTVREKKNLQNLFLLVYETFFLRFHLAEDHLSDGYKNSSDEEDEDCVCIVGLFKYTTNILLFSNFVK